MDGVPAYSSHIISWNSDLLNTALATQHVRRQTSEASTSANARLHQSSMTSTSRGIRYMLILLWLLVPLNLVAGIATWNISGRQDTSFISNYFDTHDAERDTHWPLYLISTVTLDGQCSESLSPSTVVFNILFVAALQLLYTFALHIAEQFANLHRDERAWRYASKLDP